MKRYAYKRHSRNPSAAAWLMLIVMWCASIAVVVQLGRSHSASVESIETKPTVQPTIGPTPIVEPTAVTVMYSSKAPTVLDLRGEEPRILIYHTHTTEAYIDAEGWRSTDNERNIVAVGAELKRCFEEVYGFNVIHDTTNHEPPKLSSAYDRSCTTIESYLDKYPSIQLVIDVHRDSYNVTDEPTKDFADVYNNQTARIMFVVGKGTNYDVKPNYETNYSFANSVLERLSVIQPKLIRPIRVKDGRYNQHLSPFSLLVEVGHNANSLEQALKSIPYLADAIAQSCAQTGISTQFDPKIVACFVPVD